jgi:hypothetical protein
VSMTTQNDRFAINSQLQHLQVRGRAVGHLSLGLLPHLAF